MLDDEAIEKVFITTIESGNPLLQDKISEFEERLLQLNQKTPKIIENFDELQAELDTTEEAIESLTNELKTAKLPNDFLIDLGADTDCVIFSLEKN